MWRAHSCARECLSGEGHRPRSWRTNSTIREEDSGHCGVVSACANSSTQTSRLVGFRHCKLETCKRDHGGEMGLNASVIASVAACLLAGQQPQTSTPPSHLPSSSIAAQSPGPKNTTPNAREDYVGDGACNSCHQEKVEKFHRTSHYLTSRLPDQNSILGSFEFIAVMRSKTVCLEERLPLQTRARARHRTSLRSHHRSA